MWQKPRSKKMIVQVTLFLYTSIIMKIWKIWDFCSSSIITLLNIIKDAECAWLCLANVEFYYEFVAPMFHRIVSRNYGINISSSEKERETTDQRVRGLKGLRDTWGIWQRQCVWHLKMKFHDDNTSTKAIISIQDSSIKKGSRGSCFVFWIFYSGRY